MSQQELNNNTLLAYLKDKHPRYFSSIIEDWNRLLTTVPKIDDKDNIIAVIQSKSNETLIA